jgi:chaperonin GroEL (HSP60 family)
MNMRTILLATILFFVSLAIPLRALAQNKTAAFESSALTAFLANPRYCTQLLARVKQKNKKELAGVSVSYGKVIDSMPNVEILDIMAFVKKSCQQRVANYDHSN